MLSGTFLHIPGVGPKTERRIWERGIHTWSDFLRHPAAAGLSPRATERLSHVVSLSVDHLAGENHRFFSSCLPRREHWRAYPEFGHRVAYLDIETTSLGGDDVTLIGLYDGRRVRIYQKGEDLPEFVEDIRRYGLLVTFHGAGFDLPFLRRRFPQLSFDQLHIDLCPALRRLGLKGGLKNIERQLGIPRSPETEHLDGWDAVRLWREWERGSAEALDLLKRYNAEDITHLEALIRYAYPRLRTLTGMPVGQEPRAP
jgi:uncharacterized protein YprB with RNaseH-like and TPR domain